eukprot:Ihof_evm5s166 gene=Ihof_evmTU5s166
MAPSKAMANKKTPNSNKRQRGVGKGKPSMSNRPSRQPREKASKLNVYEVSDDDLDAKQVKNYDDMEVYQYELPDEFEDEEIDEEDAFNDEDNEKYGDLLPPDNRKKDVKQAVKGKKGKKGNKRSFVEESEDELSMGSEEEEEGDLMDLSDMLKPGKGVADDDEDILGKPKKKRKTEVTKDESEDERDEGDEDHDALMKAIAAMTPDERPKHRQEVNEHYTESEYNLGLGKEIEGGPDKLRLEDLMGSLKETTGFGNLKKQLEVLQKGQSMPLPMSKPARERLDRSVAYEETKEDITKWLPFVKRNREAEHISFPLNESKPSVETNSSLTDKFKPATELEKAVSSLLEASKLEEGNDMEKADDMPMKELDMEEVKERRKELSKMRALLTYFETKRQRINKIKSKNYHKRLKKERIAKEKKLSPEQLHVMDDEEALEEMEKAERTRAEERMSMRHKNTSKWAKRLMQRNSVDPASRAALSEQLRLGDELRRKITLEKGSDEEEESDEEEYEEVEDEATTSENIHRKISDLQDNLDTPLPTTGLLGLKFMQRSLERQRAEAQKELEDLKMELEGTGPSAPGKLKPLSKGSRAKELEEGETLVDQVAMSAGHRTQASGFVTVDLDSDDDTAPVVQADSESESDNKNEVVIKARRGQVPKDSESEASESEANESSGSEEEDEEEEEEEEEEEVTVGGEANPWMAMGGSGPKKTKKDSKRGKVTSAGGDAPTNENEGSSEDESEVTAKATKADTSIKETNGKLVIEESEGSDVSDDEEMTYFGNTEDQKALIARAFAGDDVVSEFNAEKMALEGDDAEEVAPVIPGWGDWGGDGVKGKKKKKAPVAPKAKKDTPERMDSKLKFVIINEKRDKKAAAKSVKTLPHPFTDRSQFERGLQTPIGKEWNTPTSFAKNTKPK